VHGGLLRERSASHSTRASAEGGGGDHGLQVGGDICSTYVEEGGAGSPIREKKGSEFAMGERELLNVRGRGKRVGARIYEELLQKGGHIYIRERFAAECSA